MDYYAETQMYSVQTENTLKLCFQNYVQKHSDACEWEDELLAETIRRITQVTFDNIA